MESNMENALIVHIIDTSHLKTWLKYLLVYNWICFKAWKFLLYCLTHPGKFWCPVGCFLELNYAVFKGFIKYEMKWIFWSLAWGMFSVRKFICFGNWYGSHSRTTVGLFKTTFKPFATMFGQSLDIFTFSLEYMVWWHKSWTYILSNRLINYFVPHVTIQL